MTVIVAMALTLVLSFTWYVTQPLLIFAANQSENITESGSWNTTGSAQGYSIIRLAANIGFPISIVFVWLWVFVSAQSSDWRGEEGYYYE